jgi:hypothetical protein
MRRHTTIIDRLSGAALYLAAVPAFVVIAVRDVLAEREHAAALRVELDEARARIVALTDRAETAERHIERAMRDGASSVNGWTRTNKQLDDAKIQLAEVTLERDASDRYAKELSENLSRVAKELHALRMLGSGGVPQFVDPPPRATKLRATPVPVATVEPSCAWCLKPATEHAYHHSADPIDLCAACIGDMSISLDDVAYRLDIRADVCPSRRTSPDPLAIECPTCRAYKSHGCGHGPETRRPI